MKFFHAWLVAGMAFCAGTSAAAAADFGIKTIGSGVAIPVPAPAPVPTYDWDSDWYVGVTLGAILSQDARITDSDPYMPMKKAGDIGAAPIYGLSFGRYLTPSLRAEFAIDYASDQRISNSGQMIYSEPATFGGITDDYGVYRTDKVQLSRTSVLFNLLYDIDTGTRFTPYFGGGVGLTWRSIHRSYSETATCGASSAFPSYTCAGGIPASQTISGSDKTSRIDFAAAVQAGISYAFNENVVWDNGWQMLWEGGAIAQSEPTISGDNRISYKDAIVQEFRSGIRLKFN